MENEYISVKEFAEKAGISVQAVYKRLNNRLKQYVKVVDNQKMLDIRALQDIYGIKVKQPIQPKLTTSSTQNSIFHSCSSVVIFSNPGSPTVSSSLSCAIVGTFFWFTSMLWRRICSAVFHCF